MSCSFCCASLMAFLFEYTQKKTSIDLLKGGAAGKAVSRASHGGGRCSRSVKFCRFLDQILERVCWYLCNTLHHFQHKTRSEMTVPTPKISWWALQVLLATLCTACLGMGWSYGTKWWDLALCPSPLALYQYMLLFTTLHLCLAGKGELEGYACGDYLGLPALAWRLWEWNNINAIIPISGCQILKIHSLQILPTVTFDRLPLFVVHVTFINCKIIHTLTFKYIYLYKSRCAYQQCVTGIKCIKKCNQHLCI